MEPSSAWSRLFQAQFPHLWNAAHPSASILRCYGDRGGDSTLLMAPFSQLPEPTLQVWSSLLTGRSSSDCFAGPLFFPAPECEMLSPRPPWLLTCVHVQFDPLELHAFHHILGWKLPRGSLLEHQSHISKGPDWHLPTWGSSDHMHGQKFNLSHQNSFFPACTFFRE